MSFTPELTVVIICQDDESRLPEAIESARNQSLENLEIVVVDHGSTDASADIAESLALEDERIRVVRLSDRSGKPGRPLNAGIDAASAPWVVAMGSDDLMRPLGCQDLLDATTDPETDLVVGSVLRVNMDTGKKTRWMPTVTLRSRSVTDISQLPDLVRDTIGGFKLYRTQFLRDNDIRFAEDIFYQDQIFTTKCFAVARSVAITQAFVGEWRHWHTSDRKSVTQRKTTVENLVDRFEANRRLDDFLTSHNHDQLLLAKQRKFLTHDLVIHVRGLEDATPEYREMLVNRTREYTEHLPDEAYDDLPLNRWLMLRCLRANQVAAADEAAHCHYIQLLTSWQRLTFEGHTYLLPPGHALEPDPIYDVTRYGLDWIASEQEPVRGWISLSQQASGFNAEVTIQSVGRFELDDSNFASLELRDSRGGAQLLIPLPQTQRADDLRLTWRTEIKTQVLDQTFGYGAESIELYFSYRSGELGHWSKRLRPAASAFENEPQSNSWKVALEEDDILLNRTPRESWRESVQARYESVRYRSGPKPDPLEELSLKTAKDYLSDHRARRRKKGVFFESFAGRRIDGAPLYVSGALQRHRPKLRQVWSARTGSLHQLPSYAEKAPRFTRRYLDLLAGSAVWIDNGWLPFEPDGQEFIQLWHGVPLIQLDKPGKRPSWDVLVSSGDFASAHFREIFGDMPMPEVGAIQTDSLVSPDSQLRRSELRSAWGLQNRTVLTYLPALRPGRISSDFHRPDPRQLAKALGPNYFLFFQEHDDDATGRRTAVIPEDLRWFMGKLEKRSPINDYLLMTDVLISDYSSFIVDFGATGRSVIHYVPDQGFVEDTDPGTYIKLDELAAGPLVRSDRELLEKIEQVNRNESVDGGNSASRIFAETLISRDVPDSSGRLIKELGL